MKVCFVNAPYDGPVAGIWTDVFPPLTTLSLAAYLRSRRPALSISVVDGLRLGKRKALTQAVEQDADIYALCFLTFNAGTAYRFADALRVAHPFSRIIAGGNHVTSLEQDAFEKCTIDYAVHGEGEQTLVELCDAIEQNNPVSDIPGILYRKGKDIIRTPERPLIEDVDSLPFPARDLVDIDDYSGLYIAKHRRNTHILSGRGCVNHCNFCARRVWKRQHPKLRLRSGQNIVEELRILKEQFGVAEFFDMGDEFNSSEQWAIETATAIGEAKLDMPWQAFSRAAPVTDQMAQAMADSGCWLVHLGIESGNPRTLEGIGKNITLDQARESAATYQRHGIKVVGLFMLFHAWEEQGRLAFEGVKESRNTIAFARSMLKDKLVDSITCSPSLPYPGSRLFDIAQKHSLIPRERFEDWGRWDHSWGSVMVLPNVSAAAQWRVKLSGVRTQAWALLTSGHLNFSHAIWSRALGMFRMLIGSLADRIPHLGGSGRKAITP